VVVLNGRGSADFIVRLVNGRQMYATESNTDTTHTHPENLLFVVC